MHVVVQRSTLRNFEDFLLLYGFFSPQLKRKFIVTEPPFAFLSSVAQFWGILGFKRIFERWISAYLIYGFLRCLCN